MKAFRRLVEIAEDFVNGELNGAEDIVDRYGISFRTAYDYWNTLKALRDMFLKDIEEKIKELDRKMLDLRLKIEEIRNEEFEKEITKIKAGLDEIIELKKKRGIK